MKLRQMYPLYLRPTQTALEGMPRGHTHCCDGKQMDRNMWRQQSAAMCWRKDGRAASPTKDSEEGRVEMV